MVAVLFVDLDRFKLVNDGLGHDTGDELLVAVSRRLARPFAARTPSRAFGGDEFVVLCEDLRDEDQAIELADRAARGASSSRSRSSRAEVTVSASIGIAVTRPLVRSRRRTCCRTPTRRCTGRSSRGGARHELFDEAMHTQAVSRLLTERALRRALDRDELRVLFQPQFDLASGRARRAWRRCCGGSTRCAGWSLPGDFLRVAEETGIIVPIGAWVLEQACEVRPLAPRRTARDDGPLSVSANVSARQLQRPDFPELVARTVREAGVDPADAVPRDRRERAARRPRRHRRRARARSRTSACSSPSTTSAPVGRRSPTCAASRSTSSRSTGMFVEGLGRSAADDAIVAATIDMAHALGMVVAAEGVETDDPARAPRRPRLRPRAGLPPRRAGGVRRHRVSARPPATRLTALIPRSPPLARPAYIASPERRSGPMGLLDKVKETAQKGADIAKEGVKAGQDKLDEQKLKKKVGDLKEELGGVVYAQKSGTTAAGVDPEVEIARIVAEINAVEAELPDEAEDDDGDAAAPGALSTLAS